MIYLNLNDKFTAFLEDADLCLSVFLKIGGGSKQHMFTVFVTSGGGSNATKLVLSPPLKRYKQPSS